MRLVTRAPRADGDEWIAKAAGTDTPNITTANGSCISAFTEAPGSVSPNAQPDPGVAQLPRITVGSDPSLALNIAGLQWFADDVAEGQLERIERECTAVRPDVRDRYRDLEIRRTLLAALTNPPKLHGGYRLTLGAAVVTGDQYNDWYQCAVLAENVEPAAEDLKNATHQVNRFSDATYAPWCGDRVDSEYLVGGRLTDAGGRAMTAFAAGATELKQTTADSYVFGPVGKPGPLLTYRRGTDCFNDFSP